MAPIHVHYYQTRSVNTGMAFTIFFATVAIFVVVSCFIWAFLVPFLLKKYFPPKPSQTKYNQHLKDSEISISLIRTHPRNRRLNDNSRRASPTVTVYNPRLHTPFPRMPSDPESIILPTFTPPQMIRNTVNASQSLFTPVRDRVPSCPQRVMPKSYTEPRARSRSEHVKSTMMDKDFGDAKDYILALPEPLRLRCRTDGSQLIASSTLGRLIAADQLSNSADKHLHPNKLFEQLRKQYQHNSSCSSTSLRVMDAPVDLPRDSMEIFHEQHVLPRLSKQLSEQELQMQTPGHLQSTLTTTAPSSEVDESEAYPHNASIAAMHRLRTYRSLVGAPPPEPLSRAGTVTRPKTPVAKMRDIYDKGTSDNKDVSKTVSRNDTISTLFRTAGDSSDRQSSRSSATSPAKASPENFAASSLSLLPTPLRIHRLSESQSVSTSGRCSSRFKEELDDNESTVPEVIKSTHNIPEDEIEKEYINRKYDFTRSIARSRPAPLTFAANARRPPPQQSPNLARSPVINKAIPLQRPQVTSMQASSIYSRDTQGLSIARTPATPDFPGLASLRPPFSPFLPSTAGGITDSDKGTETNLIKAKRSPVDAAKQKVENWNVDMDDLDFNTSPSSSLKRALSTLGPECHSTHTVSPSVVGSRESMISTDINPSEARLSSLPGVPLRISGSTEVATSRDSIWAPGGAHWV